MPEVQFATKRDKKIVCKSGPASPDSHDKAIRYLWTKDKQED